MDVRVRSPEASSATAERLLVVITALGTMLAPLNSTMIAVALPDISRALGVGPGEAGWLVTSYLIAMAVTQPIAGSLGDLFGRRRIFLGALGGFALASIGAALASNLPALVAFRTGQAIAGAMAIPNGMALIREWIPGERLGTAFGGVGAAVALAAGVGLPLGGLLVEFAGWRAIFWVNIPLIVVVLPFAWSAFPDRRPGISRQGRMALSAQRFDFARAVLLAGALTALALAASTLRNGDAAVAIGLGTAAIALGALLVRNERRVQQPIVGSGLGAASLTIALGNLALYSLLLVMPQFLTSIQRWSSAEAGLVLAALSMPLIALSPVGGHLADRWGRRRLAFVGGALVAGGLAPFLGLDASWSVGLTGTLLALIGSGLALQTPAIQAAAVEAMPESQAGQASGVFSASRYFGGIAGSVAVAAALGSNQAATALSDRRLFALFVMIEAAAIGALISSLWLSSQSDDRTSRRYPNAQPAGTDPEQRS